MPIEVIMPALGMVQETGILVSWLKSEGDTVTKGEPLMEVETDKATVEVEAQANGTLVQIRAAAGDEVPVGDVIAFIVAEGESLPETLAQTDATPLKHTETVVLQKSQTPRAISPVAARMVAELGIDVQEIATQGSKIQKIDVERFMQSRQSTEKRSDRVLASPKARRLAQELSVVLNDLQGSGPGGAILTADVEAYQSQVSIATAPLATPESPATVSNIWRVMAKRLSEAWTTVPHFYLMREVDVVRFIEWREQVKHSAQEKITYTDLLVKVIAHALHKHPRVNVSWHDDLHIHDEINIGLAVAVDDGLLVPVIHGANKLSLGAIANRRVEVITRAQQGKLKPDDLQGGTFTISNLGMYGIDAFNAIVNPPQGAILAVGRIAEHVVPYNGQVAIRPQMTMTLSCDHRAIDGARGAAFIDTVAQFIEEPLTLLND